MPKDWKKLQYHPLASLLSFGLAMDLGQLKAHMKLHGYDADEPIVLLDGKILDGRHRHWCAKDADVVPTFAEFIGKNPRAYVVKKMLREHFNTSQRAMFAAELRKHGPTDDDSANLQSAAKAAKTMNVSERSVADADKVTAKGTEALQEMVKAGGLSVSTAAKLAELPKDQQEKVTSAANPKKAAAKATAGGTPRKKKQGQPVFDFRRFDTHLGAVIRMFDEFKHAYPVAKNLAVYKAGHKLLDDIAEAWVKIRKQATGAAK